MKHPIDRFEPDMLYTGGGILLEEYGLSLVAHLSNARSKRNKGNVESMASFSGRREPRA